MDRKYLIAIIAIGFLLRFWNLTRAPASLSGDEVSFGYNAYAISQTGRDEYGKVFPLLFQSFDDNKQPVYVYLTAFAIKLFGFSVWSVRLPSVILGTLTIPLVFFICMDLFNQKKLALLSSLLAAISPWLIQYSRVGVEVGTGLFFTLLGLWLFLKLQRNLLLNLACALSFVLAFWSYYAYTLFIIIFFAGLFLWKITQKSTWLIAIILFFGMLPYFWLNRSPQTRLRQMAISVFANQAQYAVSSERIAVDNNWLDKLLYNRRFIPLTQAIDGYLRLNPAIIFSQNPHNHGGQSPLLYLWMLPGSLLGAFFLRKRPKLLAFLIVWIVVGAIPAAITAFPPLGRRMLVISIPIIFLNASAFVTIFSEIQHVRVLKNAFLLICALIIFFPCLHFFDDYFVHAKEQQIAVWSNNMGVIVPSAQSLAKEYKKVIVSLTFEQPRTYFLFYTQYSPVQYLKEGGTISGGYLDERNHFGKYYFKFIQPTDYSLNNLYIWSSSESQPCLTVLKKLPYRENESALFGVFDSKLPGCNLRK